MTYRAEAPTPAGGQVPGAGLNTVAGYLRLIALALLVIVGYQYCRERRRDAAETLVALPISVAAPAAVVTSKIGKERVLYRFTDFADGCARVELRSDASFYPKGGKVRITPPAPGKPWDDEPGVASSVDGADQRPGWYVICRVDPGAWGVEIWN